MADCSELARTISRIALNIGSRKGFDNLDAVYAEMSKNLPEITKEMIADSIVEASRRAERNQTEIQKRIANLKKEARKTSVPAQKEKLNRDIAKLEQKLAEPPEAPKVKTETLPSDKELAKLQYEYSKKRSEVNARIQEMKPRTIFGKTAESLNAARAIMTSYDLSAVRRQGGILTTSHPVIAARAFKKMLVALKNPVEAHRMNEAIFNRDNAYLYDKAGLHLSKTDTGAPLTQREEVFISRLAQKIPGIKASERAYVTYLNQIRADTFDALSRSLTKGAEPTLQEAKAIANYINVATGAGHLGKYQSSIEALNATFFAPKYIVSRFQMVFGQPLYRGTAGTRYLVAKEYMRYLAGTSLIFGLGALAGGKIETDPRSSDFMKLRIGDRHIDSLSGLSQAMVLLRRMATGQRKVNGEVEDMTPGERLGTLFNFVRTKLAPLPSAAVDWVVGENAVHEPVTTKDIAIRMVTPISAADVLREARKEKVPTTVLDTMLSVLGDNVQHYSSAPKGNTGNHLPRLPKLPR